MADELKDQRIVTMMSQSEVLSIDDWMFENRIKSRGEAIRRLCQIGMNFDRAAPRLMSSLTRGAAKIQDSRKPMIEAFKADATSRITLEAVAIESSLAGSEVFIDLAAQIGSLWSTTVLMKAPQKVPEAIALAQNIKKTLEDPELSDSQKLELVTTLLEALGKRPESEEKDKV